MNFGRRPTIELRSSAALVPLLAGLLSSACAAPWVPRAADVKTEKVLAPATAADSIPSAAEVGLAASDEPAAQAH